MREAVERHAQKFLVVNAQAVIAEDLKDILEGVSGSRVDVFRSFESDWGADYSAAFFDAPVDRLLGDIRVRMMHDSGTHIVALNDEMPADRTEPMRIVLLDQPFRSEDVQALLGRIGVGPRQ